MEPTARTRRPLLRNTQDGKIAGVAAGLGDYFAIDPVLIRLGFLLAILAGGLGLGAYLVAWAVIPAAGEDGQPVELSGKRSPRGLGWFAGAAILALGLIALAGTWEVFDWYDGREHWPLLLVVSGAVLLLWRRDASARDVEPTESAPAPSPEPPTEAPPARPDDTPPPSDPPDDLPPPPDPPDDAPPDEPTPPPPAADPAPEEGPTAEAPAVSDGAEPDEPPKRLGEETAELGDTTTRAWPPLPPSPVAPLPPPREARHRRRLPLGSIALGAIVVSGAIAALLDATGALEISVEWFLVYALALSGAALIASAWYGRVRGPLALTAVLAAAVTFAAIVDVPLRGGVGDRTVQPRSLAELGTEQRLGVGRLVLDLRELPLDGRGWRLEAGVGVGELIVLLPPDTDASVEGRAGVGEVELFDREENGVHVVTTSGVGAAYTPGTIALDLEVGVGKVETRLASAPLPAGSA
jgi:phage shock protein PspC (stress-responsive transcriptional regulator)